MSPFRRVYTTVTQILLLQLLHFCTTPALSQPSFANTDKFCLDNGNYAQKSTYQTNLHTLLADLTTESSVTKFRNTSCGDSSDQVYGLFYCRGDVELPVCHDCVQAAVRSIVQQCNEYKEAIMWSDKCTLRYANRSFFSQMEDWPVGGVFNRGNSSNPGRFEQVVLTTMSGLIKSAAYDNSYRGFATGEAPLVQERVGTLYSLVQCVPDVLGLACERCLNLAYREAVTCCSGHVAVLIYLPSCQIMYDTAPFYKPVSPPSPPPSTPSDIVLPHRKSVGYYLIRAGIPTVTFLILLCGIAFYLHTKRKNYDQKLVVKDNESSEALQIAGETIKSATNNFSVANKLGQGGFGTVYRGRLPNGQVVAVKRLSEESVQGIREFSNEVQLLAKLQHRNLVRLLGYCLEGEEKLLVYEYMVNLSLDKFLFDPNNSKYLDWQTRIKIITGIARGMLYLHEDSHLKIVHRDLKASNILLDEEMNPKIADFGLARLVKLDQSQANTSRVVGTYGYMAPEYVRAGVFSTKSDVYSFGVLLLEIVSGQSSSLLSFGRDAKDGLLSQAWRVWKASTITELVDPSLGNKFSRVEARRCIHVGLLCVQQDPCRRPTMSSVVLMINSNSFDFPSCEGPSPPLLYSEALVNHRAATTRVSSDEQNDMNDVHNTSPHTDLNDDLYPH